MHLVIEHLEIDARYTKRITPYLTVVAACATYEVAQAWLRNKAKELMRRNISVAMYPNKISVIEDPGFQIGFRHFYIQEAILYGDSIGKYVYHLRRGSKYDFDNDFPFQYQDLGWFASIEWAHKTREWKMFQMFKEVYDGEETPLSIIIKRQDGVLCGDFIPYLKLIRYELLK